MATALKLEMIAGDLVYSDDRVKTDDTTSAADVMSMFVKEKPIVRGFIVFRESMSEMQQADLVS